MAEAATRYWRLRIDFQSAVSWAQRMGTPEGRFHPSDPEERDRMSMVQRWRAALVKQLLTPAWDVASVKWKQAAFARGDHCYTGVKPERIERAIADDLAFLAAHPVRQSNSEAMAHRREFKEAMRQRIRDIAESRDLSDEEIRPVLKLKHHEIANFTEKHGVNVEWLLEGKGRIFKSGRHHEAPAPIAQEAEPATACGAYETAATVTRKGAASGPRSRARRFTLAGFLFSPRARTKAQFNGVGRLRTYISFTHSVF